jgi:hypothetical protein
VWSQVTLWSLSGKKAVWPRAAVLEPGGLDGVVAPVEVEDAVELNVDAEKAVEDAWENGVEEDVERDEAVNVDAAEETAVRDDVDEAEKAVLDGVLGGPDPAGGSRDDWSLLP